MQQAERKKLNNLIKGGEISMKKQRHKIIPAVYLILEKEGKFLLQRRINTGFMDGYYSLVAGHLEAGESLAAALVREAIEEAGIQIFLEDLKLVHVISKIGLDGERVDFFFHCKRWKGEPVVMEKDKSDELSWFARDNFPENTVDFVKMMFERWGQGTSYSEFGW
jgi:ADP-ribose pyrophosphatase YjhB (NUDIX family)